MYTTLNRNKKTKNWAWASKTEVSEVEGHAVMQLLFRSCIIYYYHPFTVFIFIRKKCKKRYLAKPGSKPVTTRVTTEGCLIHSATELV